MITCDCGAALPVLGELTCETKENFGQIQKLIFVPLHFNYVEEGATKIGVNGIKKDAAGTGESVAITALQALLTATGKRRGVITPYVEAPTQEGGDAITFGGGNDTVGGVEEIVGSNASNLTFALRKWAQSMIKRLKAFGCVPDLGVYFVGEHGQIEGEAGTVTVEGEDGAFTQVEGYRPFPVRSFFVSDKVHGGLQEPDSNSLQFSLLPNYSDDLRIVNVTGGNPLTDLIQVAE